MWFCWSWSPSHYHWGPGQGCLSQEASRPPSRWLPACRVPPTPSPGCFYEGLAHSHTAAGDEHFPGESAHLRPWGRGLKLLLQVGQGPLHGEGVPVMLQEQVAVPQVSDFPLNQAEGETSP